MKGHSPGWWIRLLLALVAPLFACAACGSMDSGSPSNQATITTGQLNQARVVAKSATVLGDSRDYLATLKMYKSLPLHPFKTAWNESAAQPFTIPVGATTYAEWPIGKQLAASGYAANLFLKSELSHYVVKVEGKQIQHSYAYVDSTGTVHSISPVVYAQAAKLLRSNPALTATTVNTGNATLTYVLHQPLSTVKFAHWAPLVHYWVTVQISNQSFTTSVTKLVRNAFNKEKITLEVPEAVYNQGQLWNPHLNPSALMLRGHVSQLHGKIVARRTQVDPRLVTATTSTGQTMVLPRSDLPS